MWKSPDAGRESAPVKAMPYFARRLAQLMLITLVVLAFQGVVWACPTCKDGLAQNDPVGQSLVQGYFWSILFMMSMPFLIFSALGGYFYWEIRKARSAQGTPAGGTA